MLLTSLGSKLLGFEHMKDMYASDLHFSDSYSSCSKGAIDKFFKQDGYLFQENRLCS